MKLKDFNPVKGYVLLETTVFEDVDKECGQYFDNFQSLYAKDKRSQKFEAEIVAHPDAKIYKYNDTLPLSGSRGYILVEGDEIVAQHIMWRS